MVDTNMATARRWADEIGPPPKLPSSLNNVDSRARLVDAVDSPLISNSTLESIGNQEKIRRIAELAKISKSHIPDVEDDKLRVNITLRLWSGCLSSAKTIALETRSGENTPDTRRRIFGWIDATAETDPIYRAGVEAGPSLKKLRKERFSFEGVPENSVVRRYP